MRSRPTGRTEFAAELARRAWEMYEPEWSEKRHSHENFHARDPARHESHDSDPFYSWGALIPLIWEAERGDVSPWDGVVLAPGGSVPVAGRTYTATVEGERMVVAVDGQAVLTVSPPRRLTHVEVVGAGDVRYEDDSHN